MIHGRIPAFNYLIVLLICFFTDLGLRGEEPHNDTLTMFLKASINQALDLSNQNPDSAQQLVDELKPYTSYEKYPEQLAELLRIEGLIRYYKVDYASALDYFIESRNLYHQLNDVKGEATAINNIAVVYQNQKLYNDALNLYKESLEMRINAKDSQRLAGSYNNIAVTLKYLGKNQEALNYYHQAFSMAVKQQDFSLVALCYNNLANLFLESGQPDLAFYHIKGSIDICTTYHFQQYLSNALVYLGQYYIQEKRYQQAIEPLKKALDLAKEIGIVYEIQSAADELQKAYATIGDYKNAYRMHVLAVQMSDSANNLETIQRITRIESEMKFEQQQLLLEKSEVEKQLEIRKQKQSRNFAYLVILAVIIISMLVYRNFRQKVKDNKTLKNQNHEIERQNSEIMAQRDKIEALNQTKDKFFAIIAHDLKNPLGGIFRLSEILSTQFESLQPQKRKIYIDQIFESTKKTYNLLENLLQWSMFQMGAIPVKYERLDLIKIITDSIELLHGNAAQKKISVEFNYTSDSPVFADEQMLNTTIRNLLSNAIKFTPICGRIVLNCDKNEEYLVVEIKDSGIGISPEDINRLFATEINKKQIGNSKEKGTGLGLILCKEFVEQMGGKLWVKSEPEKGSSFYFTVPTAADNERLSDS